MALDTANWEIFKAAINSGGLQWTFSPRGKKVVFLNMVVKVVGDRLDTAIYYKPQALHLYLPINSYHAPGVIYELICGMVLQIYSLCSRPQDVKNELVFFF